MRRTTHQSQPSRGFTLIELLVVIAIISILAAILFPVFAAAREKARQTTCASNMKQLGLAFVQYNQDYDETFLSGANSTHDQGWAYQVYPYVKATAAYTCPDDLFVPTAAQITNGYTLCSYFANPYLMGGNGAGGTNGTPIVANQLISPALTVELGEATNSTMSANSTAAHPDNSPTTDGLTYYSPNGVMELQAGLLGAPEYTTLETPVAPGAHPDFPGRHTGGGANWLAFDGHVKFITSGGQISPGRSEAGVAGCGITTNSAENTACRNAAGTSNMTDNTTHSYHFTLTFSPL